jgi:hypothetical protein
LEVEGYGILYELLYIKGGGGVITNVDVIVGVALLILIIFDKELHAL